MIHKLTKTIIIYTDGGARGNPGHAAYGFVVYNDKKQKLFSGSRYLNKTTNNQAEYKGVVGALEFIYSICENNKSDNVLTINFYLDSKLIVEQMNGNYKIKNEGLKLIYWNIKELISKIGANVNFFHIPREKNKVADRLVNEEIDRNIK
jgi:ribonuclease HI